MPPSRETTLRAVACGGVVVPRRSDSSRFRSYSAAIAELAAPALFQNRATYRMYLADLADEGAPRMRFGRGWYFDGIDLDEACAHEYAAARLGRISGMPLRDAIGVPCRPDRKPTNLAVATLILRHDAATGDTRFPLHWRDPAKVAVAGGMYMVIPVGMFQPANHAPDSLHNDFSLWRCVLREFAEEVLGAAENSDADQPIDYGSWLPAKRLGNERRRGRMRIYALGMGADPLTLATDLLTVAIIDADLWDELAGDMVTSNPEGQLAQPRDTRVHSSRLFPFTATSIDRLIQDYPLEISGAALLRLAWEHRHFLIG